MHATKNAKQLAARNQQLMDSVKSKVLAAAKDKDADIQSRYDNNLGRSVLLNLNEVAADKSKLSELGLGATLEFVGGSANSGNVAVDFVTPTLPALGLALDFDADTISGVDGSAIPQWLDSSGNNVVATVAAGSPLLKTGANGIAGHNVVRFASGTARTSYLSFPLVNRNWMGLTVYYVARSGAGLSATRYGGVFGWQAGGQYLNIALGSATDGQGAGWAGSIGSVTLGNVTGYAAYTPFWSSYRYDKTQWTIEGVEAAGSPPPTDTSWPTDAVVTAWIGSNYYPGSQSDNDVARIIVYDRKLTDDEDAQVVSYLKYRYGFSSTAPQQVVRIGYPDTLTNKFSIRYAHPAGDDANDGKTWQTAKETLLAAWDSARAEIGIAGLIELHFHDGTYVGGEVQSQGLWLGSGSEGLGWRQFQPHRIYGHGGLGPGRGFSFAKARLLQGHPGDSQDFDKAKPLIWMSEGSGYGEVYDLMPGTYGFARLGVKPSGTRDGNLEGCRWSNVQMISPPDTDPVFGPCFDCGWISEFSFNDCQAAGSAVYRDVTLSGTDHATAASSSITLASGGFDPTYVGGYLIIYSGANGGQWFIDSVTSSTTVVVHGPRAIVDETFTTETIQKVQGPSVIDDDDHAGFLFRPTDVSGGEPGSMGTVHLNNLSTQQCGVKYYLGAQGEIGLFITGNMITEGGPQPHPIQIKLMPGATVPSLVGTNTQVDIAAVSVADGLQFDSYYVYIDQVLHVRFGVGTVMVGPMQGGAVYGPAIWRGNDAIQTGRPTTPQTQRQFGWFSRGKLTGNHAAGRRLGAPGTALPSSSGSAGNGTTNLLEDNPGSWGHFGPTYTPGIADNFGLSNAGQIASGSGQITVPQSALAPAATTLAVGDCVVFGVWTRGVSGPNETFITLSMTGDADFDNANLQPATWLGNAEWEYASAYATVTVGGTGAFSLNIQAGSTTAIEAAYPLLVVLKASDGYTEEAAAEMAAHLASWNPALPQGASGTLRNQKFIAAGGLGTGRHYTVGIASGNITLTGANGNAIEIFDASGNSLGVLPLQSFTVNP